MAIKTTKSWEKSWTTSSSWRKINTTQDTSSSTWDQPMTKTTNPCAARLREKANNCNFKTVMNESWTTLSKQYRIDRSSKRPLTRHVNLLTLTQCHLRDSQPSYFRRQVAVSSQFTLQVAPWPILRKDTARQRKMPWQYTGQRVGSAFTSWELQN